MEIYNNFLNGDCIEVLDNLIEDGIKVNSVVTSPPYNTSRRGEHLFSEKSLKTHSGRYDMYMDSRTDEEYIKWLVDIFNKLDKIIEENGIILFNISYSTDKPSLMWLLIAELINKTNFMVVDTIYWKKKSALPNNMSPNRLTRIVEPVFVFSRKGEEKTYQANKKVKSIRKTGQKSYENVFNYIDAKNNDGSNNLNKATFSSDLIYSLLEIYAMPNDVVLDPFMGTGTTAIGCLKYNKFNDYNLKYLGIELSPKQVKYSEERVKEYNKPKGLWD